MKFLIDENIETQQWKNDMKNNEKVAKETARTKSEQKNYLRFLIS